VVIPLGICVVCRGAWKITKARTFRAVWKIVHTWGQEWFVVLTANSAARAVAQQTEMLRLHFLCTTTYAVGPSLAHFELPALLVIANLALRLAQFVVIQSNQIRYFNAFPERAAGRSAKRTPKRVPKIGNRRFAKRTAKRVATSKAAKRTPKMLAKWIETRKASVVNILDAVDLHGMAEDIEEQETPLPTGGMLKTTRRDTRILIAILKISVQWLSIEAVSASLAVGLDLSFWMELEVVAPVVLSLALALSTTIAALISAASSRRATRLPLALFALVLWVLLCVKFLKTMQCKSNSFSVWHRHCIPRANITHCMETAAVDISNNFIRYLSLIDNSSNASARKL